MNTAVRRASSAGTAEGLGTHSSRVRAGSDPLLMAQPSEAMSRAPLVLVASEDEWTARSLGTILAPRSYGVLRAYSARQALELAETVDPDAVFIDAILPGMDCESLCRALLERRLVSRAAPLILLVPPHTTREQRLKYLEAGAWEAVQLPLDVEELLLRIDRFVQGKLESDRVKATAVIDRLTGLYNQEGILQRVREVGASAERFGRPLACIVIGATPEDEETASLPADELVALAQNLRRSTRQSDVLARIGVSDFAVIAPDTPPEGARILANRLRNQGVTQEDAKPRPLRAGFYAVADPGKVPLDALDLVKRAATASRSAPTE
jgi:two-component system, cell cycle response regulator